MEVILEILPILSFLLGLYVGISIGKKGEIKTPAKLIKEKKIEIKEEKKKEALEQYLENIDNYPKNQKEIKE